MAIRINVYKQTIKTGYFNAQAPLALECVLAEVGVLVLVDLYLWYDQLSGIPQPGPGRKGEGMGEVPAGNYVSVVIFPVMAVQPLNAVNNLLKPGPGI
jgi:hypothetical protein